MENGAFALLEQMLHFPLYFQIHDISNASKCVIMEYRVNSLCLNFYRLVIFQNGPGSPMFAYRKFYQNLNKNENSHQQPSKQKWTGPIDKDRQVHPT